MASYAESGVDWAGIWRDNRGDLGAVALVVAFITAMILGGCVTPFYYYDRLVAIAVATIPALLAVAIFAGLGDRVATGLEGASPLSASNAAAGILLIGIVSPGNVVLWANERFDTSPSTVEVAPVVEKWSRFGRGRTTYLAGVTTGVPSPLGEHSFYSSQPVAVSRAQWERIVPGTSRLLLREHRGALRAVWFEPVVEVAN